MTTKKCRYCGTKVDRVCDETKYRRCYVYRGSEAWKTGGFKERKPQKQAGRNDA